MDDMTLFEDRFAERLNAFAKAGVQSVDSAAVARTIAIVHPRSAITRPARRRLLDEIHRTRQQVVLGPWRTRPMIRTTFAAAAVVVLIVGGAFFIIQRDQPGIGGLNATASPSASPSHAAVASPSAPPTPFVVPDGRTWSVTVRNESSDPTTLFVTEDDEAGMRRQCGTVTPSVVPPDTTMKVTFLLPPKSVTSCWIWVNPDPGEGGSFFQTSDAPLDGEFFIRADGQTGWLGP